MDGSVPIRSVCNAEEGVVSAAPYGWRTTMVLFAPSLAAPFWTGASPEPQHHNSNTTIQKLHRLITIHFSTSQYCKVAFRVTSQVGAWPARIETLPQTLLLWVPARLRNLRCNTKPNSLSNSV